MLLILRQRDRDRERGRDGERGSEKERKNPRQAPHCQCTEPDVGLDLTD